jgi:hypothetical protein
MNHFTDQKGYNGIRASVTWHFKASQPPGDHPFGAYFTTLPPTTPKLAKRLGIPRAKLEYLFSFEDVGDLHPIEGDRGRWIFYSAQDYDVEKARQHYCGRSDES